MLIVISVINLGSLRGDMAHCRHWQTMHPHEPLRNYGIAKPSICKRPL